VESILGTRHGQLKDPQPRLMLKAFEGVTLTKIEVNEQTHFHLTPLNKTQESILRLLAFSPDIYLNLTQHFSKPLLI
jgi:hypothetical protein